ncbi:hypothetical protein IE53DRAFT_372001 [Violaceomyces palustris]|uniref:Uncharacterized protein n=1 Tax=Violaceomyces palustris TaxID=1673888 RepID=A0ACD0NLW2_9BASI|nr:hypothetical protein IE53DRAFT_372001 [Violaceomyces palustris]
MSQPSSSSSSRTSPTALRPLSTSLGSLKRSDGSASFSFGNLESLASVNAPVEVRIRDELTDRATLEVLFQPLQGVPGIPTKTFTSSLQTLFSSVLLLHHHPRSLVQLVIQTTSSPSLSLPTTTTRWSTSSRRDSKDDQGTPQPPPLLLGPDNPPTPTEKAAAINASSLALLDAGFPARGTVAACACAVLERRRGRSIRRSGGRQGFGGGETEVEEEEMDPSSTIILLDPTPEELELAISTHVFGFLFYGSEPSKEDDTLSADLVMNESVGPVEYEDYLEAMDTCRQGAKSVLGFMRKAIERRHLSPSSGQGGSRGV